jgi:raffinose/stachyose/melibiose transport system permease protein
VVLVNVWRGIGIATVIFIAGILSTPLDFFDSARLDGGTWVKFRHVIPPLARNACSR